MEVEEAAQSEDLTQCMCQVNGRTLTVLYDSGSTHSFISRSCVTTVQLTIPKLPYDFLISTPTNKPIRTSQVYVNILLQIEGKTFVANLISLPLYGYF